MKRTAATLAERQAIEIAGRLMLPKGSRPLSGLHAINRPEEADEPMELGVLLVGILAWIILPVATAAGLVYLAWQIGLWIERELTR